MRLRRTLALLFLAFLPSVTFGAPSVSTVTVSPVPLTPGTPFEVRVEASDVTGGFVYVDFRPLAASLLRLPLSLNNGAWTAAGVVPAALRPTATSTASVQALMTKGAQRATKTVKVALAPQSGGGGTPPSTIAITSPANLATVNTLRLPVTGTISANQGGIIQVNGATAVLSGTSFSATVDLHEGNNSISAVLTDGLGRISSTTIQVTVDTEPPRLTIDAPRNGAVLSEAQTAVSGMINDTVVGTVNGDQATVHVNGMPAVIANRTFVVMNVPLVPGENLIEAIGTDRVGNRGTNVIRVTYAPAVGNRLQIVSGDGQSARIGDLLPQPLVVRALDADSNPIPNKTVIFKVIQNDGVLTGPAGTARSVLVDTDDNGLAQVRFRLGIRAGAGNNQVSATVVGFQTEPVFCASATPGPPGLLVLDAGNNQIGSVSQPLPRALATIIVDAGNNRLQNVPVTFTVLEGGGSFSGQPTTTVNSDSDGRAITSFTLGPNAGNDNNRIEATFPGNTGIPVVFVASARVPGNPAETSISGVVLDNSDLPVPGAILRILGHPVATRSDENGYFQIKPAPVGAVRLIADGSTVTRPGSWVWLQFDLVTIPGHDNDIGMPIRLLPIDTVNGLQVDETHGGTLTLPHAPGYSLTVISNSALFPNGSRSGVVSVTLVHPDKMPDPPSFGQQPRFLVSIQPANTVFNPPAPMCIPNLDALPPGQKTDMYSYDHDMGRFVSIGTGTISEDGLMLCSDPGNGVIKGGWHCGGNPAEVAQGLATSVTVSPTPIVLCKGEEMAVTANGQPQPPFVDQPYSWTAGGNVTISDPEGDGSATIKGVTAGKANSKVTYRCKSAQTAEREFEVTVADIVKDSVTGADHIGTDGDVDVYATAKGAGDVVITIKTDPAGAALPEGKVTWSGGSAGANQLSRKVSKAALIEAGVAVTATCGTTQLKFKVHVFEGAPAVAATTITVTRTRDDTVPGASEFGKVDFNDVDTPDETYKIYYDNKKWKFVFEKLEYELKWGVHSLGRTDVPNGAANPFPLGMGMAAGSTEAQKKTQAKADLTPAADGRAPRARYWSSALTTQHEIFHMDDWNNYHPAKVTEAETTIEAKEVAVTLANLVPATVLAAERGAFDTTIYDRTQEAWTAYNTDSETRAYADGLAGYTALSNAIVP